MTLPERMITLPGGNRAYLLGFNWPWPRVNRFKRTGVVKIAPTAELTPVLLEQSSAGWCDLAVKHNGELIKGAAGFCISYLIQYVIDYAKKFGYGKQSS